MQADRALRVGVVEPYLGGSHRAWAEGYAEHSAYHVEVFGMPAQHWKWRMQGAHVTIARQIEASVAAGGPFDALLVSGMTNLPALLGLLPRDAREARVVLYMHENQLTFPMSPHDDEDLTYAMINWTSMVAADEVVFNSEFHRRDWFGALPRFLRRFPDHRHTGLIDEVAAKSSVLPVGVDLAAIGNVQAETGDVPLVLWNQRWEYDKAPEAFVAAISTLAAAGDEFEVAVAGERPAEPPAASVELRSVLGERLVFDACADIAEYRHLLRRADVVVSSALHEFFGVAIVEAMYAGAMPVLPRRLVYPERVPEAFHARCLYGSDEQFVERLAWAVRNRDAARRIAEELRPSVEQFDWRHVAPRYDAALVR